MQATAPMVQHRFFLNSEMKLHRLCEKAHAPGSKCQMPHVVPDGALWQGTWPKDILGDLREQRKLYVRAFRKRMRKWHKLLADYQATKPAVAFIEAHNDMLTKHRAAEPVFDFQPQ